MTSTRPTRSHRELVVWREAVALAGAVDRVAAALPVAERFGLGGRLRRIAGSVPVRIAAGHGCGHRGSYLDHLSGALGALAELQLQLVIVTRLRYLAPSDSDRLDRDCGSVRRQLGCLVASLHAPAGAGEGAGAGAGEGAGAGAGEGAGAGAGEGAGGVAARPFGRRAPDGTRAGDGPAP